MEVWLALCLATAMISSWLVPRAKSPRNNMGLEAASHVTNSWRQLRKCKLQKQNMYLYTLFCIVFKKWRAWERMPVAASKSGNFCCCAHTSLSLPTSTHRSRHYEWHRRYGDYGRPRPFKADRRGRSDYKKNKGNRNLNQYGNKSFRYLIRCALDHSLACSLAHSLLARSIVRSFVRSCVASVLARSLIRMLVRDKMR